MLLSLTKTAVFHSFSHVSPSSGYLRNNTASGVCKGIQLPLQSRLFADWYRPGTDCNKLLQISTFIEKLSASDFEILGPS